MLSEPRTELPRCVRRSLSARDALPASGEAGAVDPVVIVGPLVAPPPPPGAGCVAVVIGVVDVVVVAAPTVITPVISLPCTVQ